MLYKRIDGASCQRKEGMQRHLASKFTLSKDCISYNMNKHIVWQMYKCENIEMLLERQKKSLIFFDKKCNKTIEQLTNAPIEKCENVKLQWLNTTQI